MRVLSTTHLFHYALGEDADLGEVVRDGLRPLSDFPDSNRWREIEREAPGFFERVYRIVAEPVLAPVRAVGDLPDAGRLPAAAGQPARAPRAARGPGGTRRRDPRRSHVGEELDGTRVSRAFGPAALEEAAALWDDALVTELFGRDRTRLFFHVPQVAAYQPRIELEPGDLELSSAAESPTGP